MTTEATYIISQAKLNKVVKYVLEAPTGMLPGGRLAEILQLLDTLPVLPVRMQNDPPSKQGDGEQGNVG